MERRKDNHISIDVLSILSDLRHQWWCILLGGFIGVFVLLSYYFVLYAPSYQATTILAIYSNNTDVLANSYSADEVLTTLTTMLNEEVLIRMIEEEYGVNGDDFTITAVGITSTNLINIAVASKHPRDSILVLHAVLEIFEVLLDQVMSDVRLVTIQNIGLEDSLINDTLVRLYLILSCIGGMFLSAIAVVILSITRNTIKNYSDLKHKVHGWKMGYIPYVDYKKNSSKQKYWREEKYKILTQKILRHFERNKQQILLVTSSLPNEGKTSVSIELAEKLSLEHKTVLLIDGDFRNPSINNVLQIPTTYYHSLQDALIQKECDLEALYCLEGTSVYCLTGDADNNLNENSFSNGRFEALLINMKKKVDYIIIDSSPTGIIASNEIIKHFCDKVLFIVGQDMTEVDMINRVVDDLEDDELLLGCVLRHTRKQKMRWNHESI